MKNKSYTHIFHHQHHTILFVVRQNLKYENWLILSYSELLDTEFNLVKVAFTNLDTDDKSPGNPIPPILYYKYLTLFDLKNYFLEF